MIIPINVAPSATSTLQLPPQFAQFGTDEIVLVELQGELDVEGGMKGQFVGKLKIDLDMKKPTLLIGHNLLEGKLVNLAKPLAVINRVPPAEEDSLAADDGGTASHHKPPRWNVVAVVKRKMVFAKRPMPIVGMGKAAAVANLTENEQKIIAN